MKILTTAFLFIIYSIVQAQSVQWVQNGGGASFDGSYSVCVDAQGFSYVTGRFTGTANFSGNTINSYGLQDGYLAKYDPQGNLEWITHIGGLSMDLSSSICLDNSGHVIIAGQFAGVATFGSNILTSVNSSYDCFIAQYDTSGNCIWALQGGSSQSYDNISGIAVDAADDIYVIGWLSTGAVFDWYTAPVTGVASTFIAKVRSTGSVMWATASCIHTSGSMPLYALKVTPDAFGNTYITANFSGNCTINGGPITAQGLQDLYVQKLDFSGNILWTNVISGLYDDAAYGIATDNSGNVIVSGYYKGTVNFGGISKSSVANSQDIFLVKYNSIGGLMWVQSYGGPNGDYAGSITVTPGNNIIFAASFSLSTQIGPFSFTSYGGIDALVIYTNSTGMPLWVINMGGTGTDQAFGIVERSGEIFCSGIFNGTADFYGIIVTSNGNGDAFLLKISSGTPLPVQLISFDALIDSKNNSVNCTWTTASENNNDFFTLEKSIDGKTFHALAYIDASNSNQAYHNYKFIDEHPYSGTSYYRLSQTDLNGSAEILKTVTINYKTKSKLVVNYYPTVGNGLINVDANKPLNEIRVFDSNGNLIRSILQTSAHSFNLTDLQKGLYIIGCIAGDEMETGKIIIQ